MMIPPALLRLRLHRPDSQWPTLWLPLFLLWPLLLLLFALLAPLLLLALCVVVRVPLGRAIELLLSAYGLVCATRGTRVDVVGERAEVLITVF